MRYATVSIQRSSARVHRHGGRVGATRLAVGTWDARMRMRRNVPRPHWRHTVMSIPVRRSIIASGDSGSRGSGSG